MIVGVGCDIVAVARFQEKDNLAKRVLTDKEYEKYAKYKDNRKTEYLAGRFAAKEAIIKALPTKKVLSEIEILNDENDKPFCIIEGYKIHISISHEKEYATAYAICEEEL